MYRYSHNKRYVTTFGASVRFPSEFLLERYQQLIFVGRFNRKQVNNNKCVTVILLREKNIQIRLLQLPLISMITNFIAT